MPRRSSDLACSGKAKRGWHPNGNFHESWLRSFSFLRLEAAFGCGLIKAKKQGATGITTVAPYVAGQWGRGKTGCLNDAEPRDSFPPPQNFFAHG
jgi:hypothetical protein